MRFLSVLILVALTGCAQLMKGDIQPVKVKDAKNRIMFTTCNGAVEDWASCYAKARNTCENGYKTLEQNENANGGFRNLTFQCK